LDIDNAKSIYFITDSNTCIKYDQGVFDTDVNSFEHGIICQDSTINSNDGGNFTFHPGYHPVSTGVYFSRDDMSYVADNPNPLSPLGWRHGLSIDRNVVVFQRIWRVPLLTGWETPTIPTAMSVAYTGFMQAPTGGVVVGSLTSLCSGRTQWVSSFTGTVAVTGWRLGVYDLVSFEQYGSGTHTIYLRELAYDNICIEGTEMICLSMDSCFPLTSTTLAHVMTTAAFDGITSGGTSIDTQLSFLVVVLLVCLCFINCNRDTFLVASDALLFRILPDYCFVGHPVYDADEGPQVSLVVQEESSGSE